MRTKHCWLKCGRNRDAGDREMRGTARESHTTGSAEPAVIPDRIALRPAMS